MSDTASNAGRYLGFMLNSRNTTQFAVLHLTPALARTYLDYMEQVKRLRAAGHPARAIDFDGSELHVLPEDDETEDERVKRLNDALQAALDDNGFDDEPVDLTDLEDIDVPLPLPSDMPAARLGYCLLRVDEHDMLFTAMTKHGVEEMESEYLYTERLREVAGLAVPDPTTPEVDTP